MTLADAKSLMHTVIWPASAGNVAWAFFTVAIEHNWDGDRVATWDAVSRLIALGLLAVYLAANWLYVKPTNDKGEETEGTKLHWFFDGLFLAMIVWFAIASQLAKPEFWRDLPLVLVFAVAALGHGSGARGDPPLSWNALKWGGIPAAGLILLLAHWIVLDQCGVSVSPNHRPISLIVVLGIWWWCRVPRHVQSGPA